MKKLFVVAVLSSFLFLISSQVKALDVSSEAKAETKTTSELSKPLDVGNKICPVSGEKIDEKTKATYEYEGKTYNFCCPMCIDAFKKDPEKYIKIIEEQAQDESKMEVKHDMKMMEGQGSTH